MIPIHEHLVAQGFLDLAGMCRARRRSMVISPGASPRRRAPVPLSSFAIAAFTFPCSSIAISDCACPLTEIMSHVEYMPLEQCFHLLLELHAKLIPVTLVLSMDEKGSKQVDVLDVQPATAAREQIAAAVFEWQLGLHKTMLARFLPPIKISVEVPRCIVEHQTSPARVVLVFRKGCREVSQSVAP